MQTDNIFAPFFLWKTYLPLNVQEHVVSVGLLVASTVTGGMKGNWEI
jgi:hypothetical protein